MEEEKISAEPAIGSVAEPVAEPLTPPLNIPEPLVPEPSPNNLDIHPADSQPVKPSTKSFAVLDAKDIRRLNSKNYEELSKKFENVYLVRHKKTGKIAEIHAASAVHAATLLGWNPKKTQVLIAREKGKEPVVPEPKSEPSLDESKIKEQE
jgi:hypothetical protein